MSPEPKTLDEAVAAANAAIAEFERKHQAMQAAAHKLVEALFSPAAEKKIAAIMKK